MLRVAGIEPSSIVDGPGFRYTIFLQGCSHHCKGCHNPATWDFNGGKEMAVCDIVEGVKKAYYIDGVTISGGEPLDQAESLVKLMSNLKDLDYHIILFSGYTFEQIIDDEKKRICIEKADVLIDGEFMEELRTLELRFRGSSNQRVIDVPASLSQNQVVLLDWDEQ